MITDRDITPSARRWGGWRTVSLVVVGTLLHAGVATAAEPGFHAGGKFYPLIVSPDEFAVELSDSAQRPAAAQRARAGGLGVLEAVPWGARDGRFAILRVADDSAAVRTRVRQSPEFKSVNRVYRLGTSTQPILSSGRIVVRFRAGITDDERAAVYTAYRVTQVGVVDGIANAYVVAPAGEVVDVELDTANALYRDTRTVYAHPDLRFPVVTRQVFSGDTFYANQWHLENVGQGGGTFDADIDIVDAWRRTLGTTVLFGQLDDACDVEHEDLVANYIGISHNTADNSQSTTVASPKNAGDRHGTATMGLICARSSNGIGVAGVAPRGEFTASRGLEAFITASQVASAYTFARNQGVDVHNNSWGFGASMPNPDVIVDAIGTAFQEGRDNLGMVVCFASGSGQGMDPDAPIGEQVSGDDELSTLPSVIGVGASNADDRVAAYSNYGVEIDVLAPSSDLLTGDNALPTIITTDNTDAAYAFEPGYNDNGFTEDGVTNLADPNYTDNFGGTSASSAIVTGIAGLILALEPDYTATQVRNIIEHTCDQIGEPQANYNGVTSRSLRYGYGRVNAGTAVEATFDGFFWPERVADVAVDLTENTIRWNINDDLRTKGNSEFGVPTISVLVVESDGAFDFVPVDGLSYFVGQQVATGATVMANLLAEVYAFEPGQGTKHFGVYTVASTSRGLTYGFGVSATSDGTIIDSGVTLGSNVIDVPPGRPSVTINVAPLFGESPLTVQFEGNAQSSAAITSYEWDFGDGTTSDVRVPLDHTYTATVGTQPFFVSLTVTDVNGAVGVAGVRIDVVAPGGGDGDNGGTGGTVAIQIADPTSPDSDISSGFSPLSVILTAEVSGIGIPAQDLVVFWDLGDGNIASSLSVAHTYQLAGRFPISVSVDSTTLAAPLQSTRFLDVLATATPTPTPTATPDPENGDGTDGEVCGMGAMTAFWVGGLLLVWRRFVR